MIRTTDTGGVKLLYNGEAQNGQCLDSRSEHVGYNNYSAIELSPSYYYGTSYSYNNSTRSFSLDGTITTGNITEGSYTCLSNNSSATCSSLKLVREQQETNNYYVYDITSNQNYSTIGRVPFNLLDNSPAYVGYMYNKAYPVTKVYYDKFSIINTNVGFSGPIQSSSLYYGNSIEYNTSTHQYSLIGGGLFSTLSDYSDLIGKYVCSVWSPNSNVCEAVLRVKTISSSEYGDLITASGYLFESGNIYESVVVGDSYIDNNNGTYTINNSTLVDLVNYDDSDTSYYHGKYFCFGTSDTCPDLKQASGIYNYSVNYVSVDNVNMYANQATFINGEYVLSGETDSFWNIFDRNNSNYIRSHRYTCKNQTGRCSTLYYIVEFQLHAYANWIYYIELDDVTTIDDALDNMFTNNSINLKDSVIKTALEAWYFKNILPFDNYIEDAIYCNDRVIRNRYGGWNENDVSYDYSSWVSFNDNNSSLLCSRNLDQFSVSNPLASLNYKVGMLTYGETALTGKDFTGSASGFWQLTPDRFSEAFAKMGAKGNDSIFGSEIVSNSSIGVRPSITLKPGTIYHFGDGSKENPYYVGNVYNVYNNDNVINLKGTFVPDTIVSLSTDDYVVTSFKLNGTLVNGDSFMMPEEDVTITDIQYVQANYNITCNDGNVTVPSTGRYNSTITLIPNTGVVTSFKLNGTLMEGNSFVMPADNVAITDIVIGTSVTVESAHNPYVVNLDDEVYYENTFTGATSITVELTYETDWSDKVELYDSSTAPYPTNYGGYFGTTLTTETITINSNYLKIKFTGSGSNTNYYGFRAVITPNYS